MLNAAIKNIPLPNRMARRPVNARGFPVPWFVAKINGEWDFRVIAPGAVVGRYLPRSGACWLCGEPLGRYLAFVIGPMCAINRISSEPPSHRECAVYAVKACPFLSKPNMRRNEKEVPAGQNPAGIHLDHNPGVSLIWICRSYHPMKIVGGTLFEIGPPSETHFYREGRPAKRAEILDAIDKGLPYLREVASIRELARNRTNDQHIERAMKLLPAA